ncbi:MAG: hypothetical protein FWE35_25180 [Streptosporangiales bacterium]|nr:hypothetical protein [Streptosporangiales bacterium]
MKRSHAGIVVGAIAAASALGFAATPASAATWSVSPANTTIKATSNGNVVLTGGSAKITCTSASGSGTTGDGSNAADLATIGTVNGSGCTDSVLGGSWTITMSGGDLAGTSYDASTGTTTGTLTGATLHASGSDLGLTCSFDATGTLDGTYTNSSGVLAITGGSATISNVSGSSCGLGGISNGSSGSVSGSFTVSPNVTISAS